jgi:hypothetical protein
MQKDRAISTIISIIRRNFGMFASSLPTRATALDIYKEVIDEPKEGKGAKKAPKSAPRDTVRN